MIRRAFTLIELLVVVAIIGILLALVFPSLNRAIGRGRRIQCVSQLRQLSMAFQAYATQYRGVLPPTRSAGPADWQKSPWVGSECQWGSVEGALVPFVGSPETVRRLVRCPALPPGVLTSGVGSNGRFDYATIEGWGGFKLSRAPSYATLKYDGRTEKYPTPLLQEEDPWFNINRSNVDPFHGNVDRLGSWHEGIGNYAAVDGSVHGFEATYRDSVDNVLGPLAKEWFVVTSSGKELSIGDNKSGNYGFWNNL